MLATSKEIAKGSIRFKGQGYHKEIGAALADFAMTQDVATINNESWWSQMFANELQPR